VEVCASQAVHPQMSKSPSLLFGLLLRDCDLQACCGLGSGHRGCGKQHAYVQIAPVLSGIADLILSFSSRIPHMEP
jgi:hypothetical protein